MLFNEITKYLETKKISLITKVASDKEINSLASLKNSNLNDLTFYYDYKLLESLKNTNAYCCLITKDNTNLLPSNCYPIIVENPYIAFAHLTNFFNQRYNSNHTIHNTASIDKKSILSNNIQLDQNVIIKNDTKIGKNVIIMSNTVVGPFVEIGDDTIIYPNCTISNTLIGNNCLIQSGVVIGDRGFGFTLKDKIELNHIGNVKIGNNVHIGSNSAIDKALLDSTTIGNNVRIDNLVHVAHGVSIGDDTVIAGQVGIAGSTTIGTNCLIAGQVGISGHLKIGNNVKIAGKSGVTKNISDNMTIAGFPALDIRKWKKNIIKLNKN